MKEIDNIFDKYQESPFNSVFKTEDELNIAVINFCKDLLEVTDILSRIINTETHPNYYSINEATIVGSITRIVKLYGEVITNYEFNKLEIFSLFARPTYESFIVMKYLIRNGEQSQRHFRLVSYKARFENLQILREDVNQSHPIILRQLSKLNAKLKEDGFTILELENENSKKQKWKLDGKSFWKIHSEVDVAQLYSFIYGVGSDAIHGNWQEIFDFHLTKKNEGHFGFLYYEKCDCRVIVPLNTVLIEAILEFLEWNNCLTKNIQDNLNALLKINHAIYEIWEDKFGEEV